MTDNESGSSSREEVSSQLERMAHEIRRGKSEAQDADSAGVAEDSAPESAIAELLLKETYRGSFPHPDVLRQLDGCIVNGAERAFTLTEREQRHRHECDRKAVDAQVNLISAHVRKTDAENRDRRLIIVMAFIFAVIATVAAFIAVINGYPAGAGIIGGGAVAIIVALLRVGRGAGSDKDKKGGSP